MLIFSFRARAGRLLLLDVFLPNIVLASHVLGMSVMCILKKPLPAEDPLAHILLPVLGRSFHSARVYTQKVPLCALRRSGAVLLGSDVVCCVPLRARVRK